MNDEEQVLQARTQAAPADAEETPVETLETLGVCGILLRLARDGQIVDVRCEMPHTQRWGAVTSSTSWSCPFGGVLPSLWMSSEQEASSEIMESQETDARFSRAVVRAAERAVPEPQDKSFLERRLEDALVRELTLEFPGSDVVARRKLPGITLPDWNPVPGAIDVAVLDRGDLRVAVELKLDDVDQTLWDIYKMASASRIESVSGAYVVAIRLGLARAGPSPP